MEGTDEEERLNSKKEVEEPHIAKQDEENHQGTRHQIITSQAVRDFVYSKLFSRFLKITFILLCIPLTISTVFFSLFDTRCTLFEHASLTNCSQAFFVPHPRQWVSAWLVMSIVSPFLFMFIVYLNSPAFKFQWQYFKVIYKKGSFCSLFFLLVASLIYYFVRLIPSKQDETSQLISTLLFLWSPVNALVICFINYLPPVRWQKTKTQGLALWLKCCNNSNFFIYWSALLVYFLEVICKNAAIMLNVAQSFDPFIQKNFSHSLSQYWALVVIIIGFDLAFHARLLTFFWEKIFYGNRDLFAEPGDYLATDEEYSLEVERKRKKRSEDIELTEHAHKELNIV